MEVEETVADQNNDQEKLKMSPSPDIKFSEPLPPVVNGISNGFSEKEKSEMTSETTSEMNGGSHEKDKEKERSRDKDKDRHKHSSSSSKHRDHHSSSSSHKSKSKDKDRDRDKEKDRDRDKDKEHKSSSSSSSKDKEKSSSSSSSKHHSSSSSSSKDKDKHKSNSSSSGDKSKHSSSSSSDKHRSDKHSSSSDKKHSSSSSSKDKDRDKEKSRDDKDKDRSKDKDRDKDKSRDKDRERDRDKERSKDKEKSRDKDKERSRDKDKDREKSRDKDKERSKDKHKDKSRDKERSKDDHKDKRKDDKVKLYNGEKEKRKSDEGKHKESEREKPVKIKEEPKVKKVYVDDDDDDDDEDFQPTTVKKEIKQENVLEDEGEEEEEEEATRTESEVEDTKPIKTEFVAVKEEPLEMEDESLQIDESMKSQEEDSEDDVPLSKRASLATKRKVEDDDELSEEDIPLSMRKKVKKEKKEPTKKKRKPAYDSEEEEEDFKPAKKKKPIKKEVKKEKQEAASPTKGRKKKEEEEHEVWKWWEEEKKPDGVKWTFLEHKGPVFAPPYEPLPRDIKFYYDDEPMDLSQDAEEVATFYARMIEHEYTTMEAFNKNFFKDWTSVMTSEEKKTITDLKKCDFRRIHAYFVKKSEERKAMSKEEKKVLKEKNDEVQKEYGFCTIDGHKEKIGNFRIEPPGLFRGRGQHPKMGKLKLRVMPEDVMINCSKDSKIPKAPEGHKWKEVRHDNSVTWLASWTENVQGQVKYVMLNPSSKLKGEKDWQKYETARKLARSVDKIREEYIADWKSKEMRIRQRAVALYFIDKLALRAGNEKDEDQADTVGCCSLRVEHIRLHEEIDDKKYVVEFDFPGKDSIRYHNFVPVEKKVFRNLQLFMENKKKGDDLFDRLNTAVLNKHLNELMEGLTAKVFRTYNASITLQNQLNELTDPDASVAEKILQYNRANRAVAILCNHQRSVPKTHEKSMGNLEEKIETKKEQIKEAEKQVKEAKKEAKGSAHGKMALDKKQKCLQRLKEQLVKLEVARTDKDENKTIALGTSKLNYLDPRISVAWCKKYDVPIDKIYNKTQRDKFRWAIDMAGPDYVF